MKNKSDKNVKIDKDKADMSVKVEDEISNSENKDTILAGNAESIFNLEDVNVGNSDEIVITEDCVESANTEESEENQKPEFKNNTEKVLYYLKKGFKRYFIDAFTGMAQGLFCTLIAGTILAMFAGWIIDTGTASGMVVGNFILSVANIAKMLMGAGIGIGIAHALKVPKLVLFAAAIAGFAGAFADKIIAGPFVASLVPGNPIGAYVVSILAIEIGRLICGKTKVDIVLVPLTMMVVSLFALFVAWPFIQFVNIIGVGIGKATIVTPEVMGIIVAVSMGVLLTLPTSSAAIWLAIAAPILAVGSTEPLAVQNAMYLAGGAAVAGCACHMVGFAVQSFRENRWGGLISQGLGTSMLQIPNLMKHPQIIVPPILASIIVGPLATCVFELRCNAVGGGMGTSGLVGIFGTIDASQGIIPDWKLGVGIALCFFIIPIVVCVVASELMRKKGWIKYGDMKLDS